MTANTSGRSDFGQFRHIHWSSAKQTTSCQLVFPSSGDAKCRKETPWNAQLSDEEVTVIGDAMLLITGNGAGAITSQIRDDAATYLRATRLQVRSLAHWWTELDREVRHFASKRSLPRCAGLRAHDGAIQRLKEGRVYVPKLAERALKHYFSPANLTALRELTLNWMVEHGRQGKRCVITPPTKGSPLSHVWQWCRSRGR